MLRPVQRVGVIFDYQYTKVFQSVFKQKRSQELDLKKFIKFMAQITATKDEMFRVTHTRSYSGLYTGEMESYQYKEHYGNLRNFISAGVQVHFFATNGREKEVDNALTVDTLKNADDFDCAVLFSGDRDMLPLVKELQRRGKRVAVPDARIEYGNSKIFTVSGELLDAADAKIDLNNFVDSRPPINRVPSVNRSY